MLKYLKDRFSKIKQALTQALTQALVKTKVAVAGRIAALFKGPLTEETLDQLEQILYEADVGSACTLELVEHTRLFVKKHKDASLDQILHLLHEKSLEILSTPRTALPKTPQAGEPRIVLVVGVNGSGKTTTIAKLARKLQQEGKSVLLAAGDTFRAAAIEQLAIWAERLSIPLIKSVPGGDPAAVAFDAVTAAKARGIDLVLIDTAGRLQNKTDLMHELEKVGRVIKKVVPEAPHETLLVLDATTGQNGLDQAKTFHSFTPLTGIILTKLDGSAKGGVILSIYKELGVPIDWVGVGEGLDDLLPFDPVAYADALFKSD